MSLGARNPVTSLLKSKAYKSPQGAAIPEGTEEEENLGFADEDAFGNGGFDQRAGLGRDTCGNAGQNERTWRP